MLDMAQSQARGAHCRLRFRAPTRSLVSVEQKSAQAAIALGVVILGAGRSSRMGRPKLLLPWGGTSVLGHLGKEWSDLGARQLAIVTAAADAGLEDQLERLNFPRENRIRNPAPERGMFSSIQCAARWPGWKAALTHWVIVLGDQPHLRLATLQAMVRIAGTQTGRVVQPACSGRPRHPVLLPKTLFQELATTAAVDLKGFLSEHGATLCECDDPGLDLDIDRPEDYRQALALAFPSDPKTPRSS